MTYSYTAGRWSGGPVNSLADLSAHYLQQMRDNCATIGGYVTSPAGYLGTIDLTGLIRDRMGGVLYEPDAAAEAKLRQAEIEQLEAEIAALQARLACLKTTEIR